MAIVSPEQPAFPRPARACPGHPRLLSSCIVKTWMAGTSPAMTIIITHPASVDRPDQGLDLVGMRAEVLGELVEIGIGDLLEARLVDVGDDLDAHLLKLGRSRVLQVETALGLLHADVSR